MEGGGREERGGGIEGRCKERGKRRRNLIRIERRWKDSDSRSGVVSAEACRVGEGCVERHWFS